LIQTLSEFANLTPAQLLLCAGVVFLAGIVRGFSGFALSALIMASLAVIIPPIQLIPICFILEGTASLLMVRGGIKQADMQIVWGLVIGSAIGAPLGLYLTVVLPIETSKLIALILVMSLAIAQLLKLRFAFLASKPGLYLSGIAAGIVTGLASIGGMVVALYVLSQEKPAKTMRASLVMYLFIGMFMTGIYQYSYGILNTEALARGLTLSAPVLLGVWLGSWIFRPSLEIFYKRFCLGLLIFLALLGLARMGIA